MSARLRHPGVTGAFYAARRLPSCESHRARTPLHITNLARTSTQGETV